MKIQKVNFKSSKSFSSKNKFSSKNVFNQHFVVPELKMNENFEHKTNKSTKAKIIAGITMVAGLTALIVGLLQKRKVENINEILPVGPQPNLFKKPQYLYHMTSSACYDSIIKDGVIKKSRFDNGVFLFEKNNLQDFYPGNQTEKMINFYAGGNWADPSPHPISDKIIMLKIPVENLDEDLLGFRRIKLVGQDNSQISDDLVNIKEYLAQNSKEMLEKPLEFVYKEEIPMDKVEAIYNISLNNLGAGSFLKDFFSKF